MTRMLSYVSTWIGLLVGSTGGSLGRPPLPLRGLYAPAVLEMLLVGARELHTNGLINSSMSENRISAFLDRHMRAARIASNSSDILSWFMRPLIPTGSEGSSELVEPDFLFTWGPYPSREDSSLIVEAKRLRGAGDSLAGVYVDEGVMRFVEGNYGTRHEYGIMMGYVLIAPISGAISSVGAAMNGRQIRTHQLSAFTSDDSLCAYPDIHHSSHMQQVTAQPFTLVHLFLDFSEGGAILVTSGQRTGQV